MNRFLSAITALVLSASAALAQSSPGLVYGQVPTPGQWNSYFAAKQDTLGYTPVNKAGDVMTGKLITAASSTIQAGLNLPAGVAPTSPTNGDMWSTTTGLFIRINGTTIGPLTSSAASSFAGTSPITVSFPASVVTYAFNFAVANNFTAAQTFTLAGAPAVLIRSGAAGSFAELTIGRTAAEADFGVVGSVDQFITGTVAGDVVVRANTNLWLAANAVGTPTGIRLIGATKVTGFPGPITINGASSGAVTISALSAAGTPSLTLPSSSGTFAVSATSPLALNATSGALTCATCATTAGTTTGSALTKADDTNVTLTLGGSPTNALLNAASITAGWTGQLSLTRGGTAASLTASNGGIVYSTGSALAILSGTATAGQHLQSGSSAAPSWTTATFPSTAAAGTMLAAGTSNVISATATPTLGANGGTGGQITLSGSTSGSTVLKVAAAAGTSNFQFPVGNGSGGQVLSTDGAGVTSWIPSGGTGTVTSAIIAPGTALAVSGTCTITTTGTCTVDLSAARKTQPTTTLIGSGTDQTYTTPANALYIEVTLIPGGAGGEGSGTSGGIGGNGNPTCWKASGTACSTPLSSATGGTGGSASPGAGGTTTGTCNMGSWTGAAGQGFDGTAAAQIAGGMGGGSHAGPGGGGGTPGTPGSAGGDHSGAGGGGGASNAVGLAGSGGGGGGVCKFRINSPAATYVYTCGATGAGGTAGTSGQAGGPGGSCYIIVNEHYN